MVFLLLQHLDMFIIVFWLRLRDEKVADVFIAWKGNVAVAFLRGKRSLEGLPSSGSTRFH